MKNIYTNAIIDDYLYEKIKNIKSPYLKNRAISYLINCFYYKIDVNIDDYINKFIECDNNKINKMISSNVNEKIVFFFNKISEYLNISFSMSANLCYVIYYDLENIIKFLDNDNIFNFYDKDNRINFVDDYIEYKKSGFKTIHIFRLNKIFNGDEFYIKTNDILNKLNNNKRELNYIYLAVLFNMLKYEYLFENEKNKNIFFKIILKYAIL